MVTCLPTHSFIKLLKCRFLIIIIFHRVSPKRISAKSENTCHLMWVCALCNHVDLIYSSTATTGDDSAFERKKTLEMAYVPFANSENDETIFHWVNLHGWRCSRRKLMPTKWKVITEKWFAFNISIFGAWVNVPAKIPFHNVSNVQLEILRSCKSTLIELFAHKSLGIVFRLVYSLK